MGFASSAQLFKSAGRFSLVERLPDHVARGALQGDLQCATGEGVVSQREPSSVVQVVVYGVAEWWVGSSVRTLSLVGLVRPSSFCFGLFVFDSMFALVFLRTVLLFVLDRFLFHGKYYVCSVLFALFLPLLLHLYLFSCVSLVFCVVLVLFPFSGSIVSLLCLCCFCCPFVFCALFCFNFVFCFFAGLCFSSFLETRTSKEREEGKSQGKNHKQKRDEQKTTGKEELQPNAREETR